MATKPVTSLFVIFVFHKLYSYVTHESATQLEFITPYQNKSCFAGP